MPTYYTQINVRYPANGLECHGQFTDEAEARQFIEKELTDLYGNVWERLNDIQYAKKDDLGATFVMAVLDIRYSPEEQERQELDSLPRQIAALQKRLAELQAKHIALGEFTNKEAWGLAEEVRVKLAKDGVL